MATGARIGLLGPKDRPFGVAGGAPGDPGLFGPGSAVWQIGRERVLLAAGPAALLLQVAHPLIAAGVADHSYFQRDPFERLWSTLDAVLGISFGDERQATAAGKRVARVHARVRGHLHHEVGPFAAGTPYDAADPQLGLWVLATLVWTAVDTYSRFVRPLAANERDLYYSEMKTFGELFGVPRDIMPRDYAAFQAYFRDMEEGDEVSVGERSLALAREILKPPLPPAMKPAGVVMNVLTAGLLPPRFRASFGLRWDRPRQAAFRTASVSLRRLVPLAPPSLRYWPHYHDARRRVGETGESARAT